MHDNSILTRRGFLENVGVTAVAVMTTGTFAHHAISSDEGPGEKPNLASGLRPDSGGLDEVRWAPRVNPSLIRRLYETDARGITDEELINAVSCALHARCQSILLATEAHERCRVTCPRCGHVIVRPAGISIKEVVITCGSCAWSVRGSDYLKTYQDKHLNGGGAVAQFEAFIEKLQRMPLLREKMLAIDRLIHGFHWISVKCPGRAAAMNVIYGIAATNLIYAKNKRELLAFLDTLPYGTGSTPGLRYTKEQWERLLETSDHRPQAKQLSLDHPPHITAYSPEATREQVVSAALAGASSFLAYPFSVGTVEGVLATV